MTDQDQFSKEMHDVFDQCRRGEITLEKATELAAVVLRDAIDRDIVEYTIEQYKMGYYDELG